MLGLFIALVAGYAFGYLLGAIIFSVLRMVDND